MNEGFGKCTQIGESGPKAEWFVDNIDLQQLIDRRGVQYIYMSYDYATGNDAKDITNTTTSENNGIGCSAGLFVHDTIQWQWRRVTNGTPEGQALLVTNHQEIFHVLAVGNK